MRRTWSAICRWSRRCSRPSVCQPASPGSSAASPTLTWRRRPRSAPSSASSTGRTRGRRSDSARIRSSSVQAVHASRCDHGDGPSDVEQPGGVAGEVGAGVDRADRALLLLDHGEAAPHRSAGSDRITAPPASPASTVCACSRRSERAERERACVASQPLVGPVESLLRDLDVGGEQFGVQRRVAPPAGVQVGRRADRARRRRRRRSSRPRVPERGAPGRPIRVVAAARSRRARGWPCGRWPRRRRSAARRARR